MNRILSIIENLFMGIAVLCMVTIMLVVSADAIGRYLFHSPLPWSFELVTYFMMVTIVYAAAASTFRNDDHIGVDLFYHMMGPRMQAAAGIICSAMAIVVFAIVAYGGWVATVEYFHGNDFIPGHIAWPTWLSYLPIPLGAGLLTLRMLLHCYMLLTQGRDPYVFEHNENAMEGVE